MAADTFFANRATLTVVGTSSSANPTVQTIAVLKGVEINTGFSHEELYGMNSILRQDAAKHTAKVEVKIRLAKFDPTVASSTFFPYWVLNPTATTTPSGTIEDKNDEKLFTVVATLTGTGATVVQATVTSVYFESFPLPLPENEFVVLDMTGYGANVTFDNSA
jgi:hypothetical protein